MEPEVGWIVGAAYQVTHSEVRKHTGDPRRLYEAKMAEAFRRMVYRLGMVPRWSVPPGSDWEAFL